MVMMAMAQKNPFNAFQIFTRGETVGHDRGTSSRIEQVIASIRLDKSGKSVLS